MRLIKYNILGVKEVRRKPNLGERSEPKMLC